MKQSLLKNACSQAIKICAVAGFTLSASLCIAAYDMENLDRGVVAVAQNNSVFISWRWLGFEPDSTAFNVYRNGTKLNSSPIADRTNYVDKNGNSSSQYTVTAVINGVEQGPSSAVTPWSNIYQKIPLKRPAGGTTPDGVAYTYSPNDATVADLDGDGQYEIVLKWDPSNSKDNSQSGYTGNVYIDAYEFDGTQMWRLDLGRNIRAGAHYTQFIAYDLDSDGRAEVAMRTSDASIDGRGKVIGNASADYRNSSGYVLSGPEYLTIFEGTTGAALTSTNYVPARGTVSSWGDSYGNRVDRFLAGLAWLDGEKPSLIMSRGYYTRAVIAAWDYRNGSLKQRWVFDTNSSGNSGYRGQGAHSLSIGDVDFDGKQEIIFGAAAIDDNGQGLYNTALGHGDALHLSDMNPNRAGLEVYMVHETPSQYGNHGVEMHDAATGAILWSASGEGADVGRGVAMDIDPRYPGYEAWGSRGGLRSSTGTLITTSRPSQMNFGAYWDGDYLREILDGTTIYKWDYANSKSNSILSAGGYSAASNNSTKSTPSLSGDIFGDWREEVIWRSSSNDSLLVFTTTIETSHRIRTLMHDPQYRAAIAWQNAAYNQPPHPSFFIGDGMKTPPAPNINPIGGVDIPGSVQLSTQVSNGSVVLNWTVSNTEFGTHELYRDTDSDPNERTRIASFNSSTRSYTDTNVTPGVTYYYWIKITEPDSTIVNSSVAAATIPTGNETTLTLQENQQGYCSADGPVETTHAGYTGDGFTNTTNNTGMGINYAVQVPADGYYSLAAIFANGGTSARSGTLFVDGQSFGTLTLDPTGAWTNWTTSPSVTVYFYAGVNKLRLEAETVDGLANIDALTISGDAPQAGNCDGPVVTPTATPSATPTPTPTPTLAPTDGPVTPTPSSGTLVIEEASGFCSVDGAIEAVHAGFGGSGYANTDNSAGTAVEWSVFASVAGTYNVTLRYANGGGSARDGQYEINGNTGPSLSLGDTGTWASYATSGSVNLSLAVGNNKIRLIATGSSGLPNIDSITLRGSNISAGDCSSTPNPTVTPTPLITPSPTTAPTPTATPVATATPTPVVTPTPAGSGATCEYILANSWGSGFTASIRITNNSSSAINGWSVNWAYTGGSTVTGAWNATLSGNNPYSASSLSWNSTIQPGQYAEFGFQGAGGNVGEIPIVSGSVCQ